MFHVHGEDLSHLHIQRKCTIYFCIFGEGTQINSADSADMHRENLFEDMPPSTYLATAHRLTLVFCEVSQVHSLYSMNMHNEFRILLEGAQLNQLIRN